VNEQTLMIVVAVAAVPVLVFFAVFWGKRRKAWNQGVAQLVQKYRLRHVVSGSSLEWDSAKGDGPDGHSIDVSMQRRRASSDHEANALSLSVGSELPAKLMIVPKGAWLPPRHIDALEKSPESPSGDAALDALVEVRGAKGPDLERLLSPETKARLMALTQRGACVASGRVQLDSKTFPATADELIGLVEEMLALARALKR